MKFRYNSSVIAKIFSSNFKIETNKNGARSLKRFNSHSKSIHSVMTALFDFQCWPCYSRLRFSFSGFVSIFIPKKPNRFWISFQLLKTFVLIVLIRFTVRWLYNCEWNCVCVYVWVFQKDCRTTEQIIEQKIQLHKGIQSESVLNRKMFHSVGNNSFRDWFKGWTFWMFKQWNYFWGHVKQ